MKRVISIALVLSVHYAFSQINALIRTTEGVYINAHQFVNESPDYYGKLTFESKSKIVFFLRYSNIEMDAKSIWGYRDSAKNEYKSINGVFYKVCTKGKISVFSFGSDDKKRLISIYPYHFFYKEDPSGMKRILSLLNMNIYEKYMLLPNVEKRRRLVEFIQLANAASE